MTANLTARKLRVLIGADLQDWSLAAANFAPSQESISQAGLVKHFATLDILDLLSNPESINPKANPARWREGQVVVVDVADDGDWVRVGNLRLLEIPAASEGLITLQLGCWLAWAAKVSKEGDRSGITLGDETNAAVVAERLLVAAGIPLDSINLGDWEYIQRWPLQKEGNGPMWIRRRDWPTPATTAICTKTPAA